MTTAEQTRDDLLAALTRLARMRPEWRIGQTLANLATVAGRIDAGGVWDLEDDEALAAAKSLIEHEVAAVPSSDPSTEVERTRTLASGKL